MRLPSFRELSKEQDKIYHLPLDVNYLITGPPGTGKTVMALYRAEMYKKQSKVPIVLSYSKLLASYTNDAASELDIIGHVSTYNSWVYRTYRRHFRSNPPQLEPYKFDWPSIMPKLFTVTINDKPYLLIDEGQDLPRDFYVAATLISENFTVFADENQRITGTQSTFNDIKTYGKIDKEHQLTKNYRNTLEIAKVAKIFYAGLPSGMPELPTRKGSLPVVINTGNLAGAIEFIGRFERSYNHLEIGVFTKTSRVQQAILDGLKGKTKSAAEFYRYDREDLPKFGKPGIKVINFNSVKGLEFDVVFIPELENLNLDITNIETKMTFYVLLSRAREQLYLLFSGNGDPEIINSIPTELIERRKL
jgi:DNA helicase IV